MAPYNTSNSQYGTYYDPVGSQSGRPPSGYTSQNATSSSTQYPSSATAPAYNNSANYQSYGNTHGTQQYNTSSTQQQSGSTSSSNTNRAAAAALSSLSGTDFNQTSAGRSSSAQQYDNTGWGNPPNSSNTYSNTNLQLPTGATETSSTQQAGSTTGSSSFDRLSYNAPAEQSQNPASSYGQQNGTRNHQHTSNTTTSATPSYQSSYITLAQSQAQSQPQRYASPLQAAQAQQQQQGHNRQSSRGSNYQQSPQLDSRAQPNNRQQSASVEPASTTVDPSQVYDFRAEREKKAKIEAEKRRKVEEAEAARQAEEDRAAAEARKVKEAEEDAKRKAAEEAVGPHRAELDWKNQQRRKAREDKRQSKTAATALTQMASSGADLDGHEGFPATPEEAEMRLMFKKMREFNARNPAMLAKLWEEERQSHGAHSPQQAKAATRPPPAPITAIASSSSAPSTSKPVPTPTSTPTVAGSSAAFSASTATPSQLKPSPAPKSPAASANTTPTANQSAQGSLWPPGKKDALADIAAKWLSTNNPGRQVTKQELLDRLDRNPNYVQLCESLESLGLKFERAAFAKQLLRAVPSGNSTNVQAQQPSEAVAMAANGTTAHANGTAAQSSDSAPSKSKRTRATKAEMEQRRAIEALGIKPRKLSKADKAAKMVAAANGSSTVEYEMPSFSLSSVTREVNDMDRASPPAPATAGPSMGGPVQPLTATAGFSSKTDGETYFPAPIDDDSPQVEQKHEPTHPPRAPADKEEAARKRGFGDLVDLTAGDSDEEAPPRKMMNVTQGAASMGQQPWNGMLPGPPRLGPLTTGQLHKPSQLLQMAIGPQGYSRPQPPPANVLNSSRPAPPLPPQPKRKGTSQEQRQQERMKGRMVVEPIMRDRVARKDKYDSRTIARDVLLATGRHPDMRPLNSHMSNIMKLLNERGGMFENGGSKSDLSTIRWDLIDPTPMKKADPESVAPVISKEVDGADADDEDETSGPGRTVARQQPPDLGEGTVAYASVSHQFGNQPRGPKKQKRQARHSAPNSAVSATGLERSAMPSMGSPSHQSGTPRLPSVQATATPATAPVASTAPSSSAVVPTGYAAFNNVDEHGKKKKGRPVGWRKDIHSRQAQGLTPAKAGSYVPKRNQNSATKSTPAFQEPSYQVYKCRWVACTAELHSLDTLKKHIVKAHGRTDADDVYSCLWKDCNLTSGKGKHGEIPNSFSEIGEWLAHVEQEHLSPVAWELGDGPRGGGLSDYHSSDAYLSDRQGRSVTPIIRPMDLITLEESAAAAAGASAIDGMRRGPGRPRLAGGSSKDERAAAAELQKLEERKRVTGFSLDKTGSRLANGKRRMGFLDDEDFEDQVPAEGETESERDAGDGDDDGMDE